MTQKKKVAEKKVTKKKVAKKKTAGAKPGDPGYGFTGQTHDDKTKALISKRVIESYKSGKRHPWNYKGGKKKTAAKKVAKRSNKKK